MKLTVAGAGAWGTALARLLIHNGHDVVLWGHEPERLNEIERNAENRRYLPGVVFPKECRIDPDLARAVAGRDLVIVAVPSKAFREVTRQIARFAGIVISVTKGIECETGLTMCGVLRETVPGGIPVALSGPTLALEVARDFPTASVVASADAAAAQAAQQLLHRPNFRVYTSADPLGVELGGAIKNVIALAAGACDGLGLGDNSKAALVTRGIVEMRRLGVACGAQAETFSGLSGLGDLMVTCFSKLSRNRTLGERLGRGEDLDQILSTTASIAEGVPTARAAHRLARQRQVVTPIIDEVYATLYEGKNLAQALRDLTHRHSKPED